MTKKSLIFLLLSIGIIGSLSASNCPKQAYSTCNLGKPGHINVHLVSHSHNDLGWTKTVLEYYNGTNSNYRSHYHHSPITVKSILDSVVKELKANPTRRFVYAEIGFFWLWWNEQNEETKILVRSLIDQGRFEFIMGSWSMNDEATTYYSDIIDQQTLGFRFIMEEFGPCAIPKVAWQIDTFGHSREQASLFAQFGFDGMFLGRVDFQDAEIRSRMREREMIWQASENRNDSSSRIFTSILPNVYWPPHGFCFDVVPFCNHADIGSETTRDQLNSRIDAFLSLAREQAHSYKTNHLIMTFGNDFTHSKAHRWFNNLDNLIYHASERQRTTYHYQQHALKINIFHSTPACYLYALNQQKDVKWSVKYDDFFPYADKPHAYWTGFFTSRPTFKYNVRQASSYLKPVRQLAAIANLRDKPTEEAIATLEIALAVAQHHDAVTGTEKQYVADDYMKQIRSGVEKCIKVINDSINVLIKRFHQGHHAQTSICPLLDLSNECFALKSRNSFNLLIYNPLGRAIKTWISLPVYGSNNQVVDLLSEQIVSSDIAPIYAETRRRHVNNAVAAADYRLIFEIELPPMGFKTYSVRKNSLMPSQIYPLPSLEREFVIRNHYIGLKFDSDGNLIEMQNLRHSIQSEIKQSMCYYLSMSGTNVRPQDSSSGAYLFRPRPQTSAICLSVRQYSIAHLNQLTELHQVYNEWISQTIRIYHDSQYVEFEWQIGPIDVSDNVGKEVIMRFDSELKSHGVFYTDSNGREIIIRRRDYRPTWQLKPVSEPVAGNYYPVNSQIFIRDEENMPVRRQLTLVNDRSQGGSSTFDGSLELMLHRRLLRDDGRGVEEALNELGSDGKGLVANGVVSLIFDTVEESASLYRELAHRVNNKPLITLSNDYNTRYLAGLSGLSSQLPANLHLLTFTLEKYPNIEGYKSILVRIEHFYERNEERNLSLPVQIDLREIFKWLGRIRKIDELALGSNMKIGDLLNNRLKWMEEDERLRSTGHFFSNEFIYTFNPMEIKTFRIFFDTNF